jgi:hypothetical protein
LKTTPFNYPKSRISSYDMQDPAINPAWRSSVIHVTAVAPWNWNATLAEVHARYETASRAIEHVRKITGKGFDVGAAYVNEADVHEVDHERELPFHQDDLMLRDARGFAFARFAVMGIDVHSCFRDVLGRTLSTVVGNKKQVVGLALESRSVLALMVWGNLAIPIVYLTVGIVVSLCISSSTSLVHDPFTVRLVGWNRDSPRFSCYL